MFPETSFCVFPKPVTADSGMVATAEELSSQVGLEILKQGGNAIDASVAVAFALAVTYPQAGNLGGGGFMVIRLADGTETTIDYREKAPQKATKTMFLDKLGNVIPNLSILGHLAVGVPGTVAGMFYALEKFGTMKPEQVLEPAIKLAKEGFPVGEELAVKLETYRQNLTTFEETKNIFYKNTTFPKTDSTTFDSLVAYKKNEILKQTALANTLQRLKDFGSKDFYEGETAQKIVASMQKNKGLITLEDLKIYRAIERKPIVGTYKGYKIISMSSPSSGGILLVQMLNLLENYPLEFLGFGSSETIHYFTEVERLAYADRSFFLGDADFWKIPDSVLVSKAYAKERTKKIRRLANTSSKSVDHGIIESEQTTHFSVVDKFGNAVSNTYTLNGNFGSCAVAEGTGILLNNEMDDFSSKPDAPNLYGVIGGAANAIEPEKRMLSSMTPTIVTKNDSLFLVIGSPGGSTIITTVLQIITNVIDFKMNIAEAISERRYHHQWIPDTIFLESGAVPLDVIKSLELYGYSLTLRDFIGNAQGISVNPQTKKLEGFSDPRSFGKTVGY